MQGWIKMGERKVKRQKDVKYIYTDFVKKIES